MNEMPLGLVMTDVAGTVLSDDDRRRLCHPLVGGVILFRRNYVSPEQLRALSDEIKSLRRPGLLIAVDHEGGRVQRFIDGFTRLPSARRLGKLADAEGIEVAREAARQTGQILASELRAGGVDLSFAPVLDLDYGRCPVIGDRSFHRNPETVFALAEALAQGLRAGGMKACGKHFPGHGFVCDDSHVALPQDKRGWHQIADRDLVPFQKMIEAGMEAIMPAHIIYVRNDARAAGFSPFWLKTVLRERLGFKGAVFSDDLSMEGARAAGDVCARAQAALRAGCDMVLLCNRPDRTDSLLSRLRQPALSPVRQERLLALTGAGTPEQFAAWLNGDEARAMREKVAALAAGDEPAGDAPPAGEA